MNTVYLFVRALDMALFMIIFAGMAYQRHRFIALPRELRLLAVGLGGLIVALTYATAETIVLGSPGGPRLFVLTVPLIFLAVALTYYPVRRYFAMRHKPPTEWPT